MLMSEIIRCLRIKHGMTQEELGKVIGVQKSAIRKYESGLVENIPRSSIEKMAKLFGVSPSYLMGWGDESTLTESDLTEEKKLLLDLFDQVPEEQQQIVLNMIKAALGKNK